MGKPRIFRRVLDPIEDTLRGDNELGQKLNKKLPAKWAREVAGAALLGAKDVVPIPQLNDSKKQVAIDTAKRIIQEKELRKEDVKNLDAETLQKLTYSLFDIADDGRLNKSADALSPEWKFRIRIGVAVMIIGYFIYSVAKGQGALVDLINFFYLQ